MTGAPTAADLFPAGETLGGHFIGAAVAGDVAAKRADPLAPLHALGMSPAPEVLEVALRDFGERVGPDPIRRASHRGAAIEALSKAKVPAPAAVVDAALRTAAAPAEAGAGGALDLPTPEPWPVPVDGGQLLRDLAASVRRHVVLTAEQADAVALWIAFSHAIDGARIAPKLAVTSPTPRCGKSTLLAVLAALVPRALVASNISPAAVFRVIEQEHPTLLVDEADSFLRANEPLRGILNSGHSRDSAFVIRCDGEANEPRRFSTWCAQVIALIGGLPATLADRSIEIRLQRKRAGDAAAKLTRLAREGLAPLARRAARFAADHPIADACPAMPPGLNDRAGDNWEPLLALADAAGGEWPDRARKAAVALSGGEPEDAQAVGVLLLGDIRTVFAGRQADRMASADLVAALTAMEDRPWPEWRQGKAMSAPQLARQLGRFGIAPRNLKLDGAVKKGYLAESFADAWGRYCPPDSLSSPESPLSNRYPATARINTGESVNFETATGGSGSGLKNGGSPNRGAHGSGVAVSNPPSGGKEEKAAAQGGLFPPKLGKEHNDL